MSDPAAAPTSRIYVHNSFFSGSLDTPFMVDFSKMTADEQLAFAKWLSDLSRGMTHPGRNKPSWRTDNQGKPAFGPYLANNVWHYHSGPSFQPNHSSTPTPAELPHNERGLVSPECIHYSKKQKVPPHPDRDYTVLGFSRDHSPFLRDDERGNPLRPRTVAIGDSQPSASAAP